MNGEIVKNHKLEKINIYEEFIDGMSPEELIEWASQYLSPNRELINPVFKCDAWSQDYYGDTSYKVWLEHWVPMTEVEIAKTKKDAERRKAKALEDKQKQEEFERKQYEALKKKFEKPLYKGWKYGPDGERMDA